MKKFLTTSLSLIFIILFLCVGCNTNNGDAFPEETGASLDYLKSTVEIYNSYTDSETNTPYKSYGSGLVYEITSSGDAYVITNYHVIADCVSGADLSEGAELSLSFMGAEEDRKVQADVVGWIKDSDLAVLYARGYSAEFPIAEAIDKVDIPEPRIGERIFVAGNPLGKGTAVTEGVVSVDSEYVTMNVSYQSEPITLRQIRVDAAMNKGCSGGGLFNEDGKLLGLVNARSSKEGVDDFGYAIACRAFMPFVDKIIESHKSGLSEIGLFYFGLKTRDDNADYAWSEAENAIDISYDVVVKSAEVGTIASVFLKEGDIVRQIRVGEGEWIKITKGYYLEDLLKEIKTGDKLTFKYEREGSAEEYSFDVVDAYIRKADIKE